MPASPHAEAIRIHLLSGVQTARQLIEKLGISQATLSRAMNQLGDEVVRLGAARSIQYALKDTLRGWADCDIYRVDAQGQISLLGSLVAVRPAGFVLCQPDGATVHSHGLPWWLVDMRPQGYLGRAYAARYGAELGLPTRMSDWNDDHALRALLAHGDDVVGNLLLGEAARQRFLSATSPEPVAHEQKGETYVRLALAAASGGAAGSSAGGEQPKFTAYAITPSGPSHLLVKFSEAEPSPVSERWRDLLLAEHLALEVLREAGWPAAQTHIVDFGGQRFFESHRFDRVGALGRRALHSLAALDAEFIGQGTGGWPIMARRLAEAGHIQTQAAEGVAMLWAFGTLIGNTDMHTGNVSFVAETGRPFALAPAYDMTPMAFAPRSGGGLPDYIPTPNLHSAVANATWRQALILAGQFLDRLRASTALSPRFAACINTLENHINVAGQAIARLG